MTARVIESGSRASYTLRARSPPQHRSLGNVPEIAPRVSAKFGADLEDIINLAGVHRISIYLQSGQCLDSVMSSDNYSWFRPTVPYRQFSHEIE
jgi:hypothetical protein